MQKRRKRKQGFLSIDFHPDTIIRDVRKYIISIIALSLAVGCIIFILTDKSYQPFYQMSGTYVVVNSGYNNEALKSFDQTKTIVDRYVAIFQSGTLARRVSEETGISANEMTISASAVSETNLLTLSVVSTHPEYTYRVYQAVFSCYPEVGGNLTGNAMLRELVSPTIPVRPLSYPQIKKNVVLMSALAFVGLMMLAILFSCLHDTIRRGEDVERKLETELISEVVHEDAANTSFLSRFGMKKNKKRKKVAPLITNQSISFWYAESITRTCRKIQIEMAKKQAKVLLVTSFLENEGKSTIAANLALTLAKQGKRVILVDLDLLSPAQCKIFECGNDVPLVIGEVLNGREKITSCIGHLPKMGIYTAFGNTAYAGKSTNMLLNGCLDQMIQQFSTAFDYCIIDSSPCAVSPDAETIAASSQAALVVIRQHGAVAAAINDMLDNLYETSTNLIGCVLNDVKRTGRKTGSYRYGDYDYRRKELKSSQAIQSERMKEDAKMPEK